jgi:hypothetical protein
MLLGKELDKIMENRKNLFAEFYKLDSGTFEKILSFNNKQMYERSMFAQKFGINPSVMRTMLDYNRYHEAGCIIKYFNENNISFNLNVLDFGCCVGDYGISLARLGANVTFYDFDDAIDFPVFRCAKENLKCNSFKVPTDYNKLFDNINLAIFGEVLEHIDDPLELLKICYGKQVKYIWTSFYPYVPDNTGYFNHHGHSNLASIQKIECQEFLKENYVKTAFGRHSLLELFKTNNYIKF